MTNTPRNNNNNNSRDNEEGSVEHNVSNAVSELQPPPTRRKILPREQIHGGGVSIFSALATRSLPMHVFQPLTDLQAATEELRYASQYLDKLCAVKDPADRLCFVAAFIVSGYSSMVGRNRMPFNPLLGETFDYISEDGWRYHAEQVSHHPPISALHAEGNDWEYFQALHGKPTFAVNSISVTSPLPVRLKLSNGDEYSWNKVTTIIQNARAEARNRVVLNEGEITIKSNTGVEGILTFCANENNTVTGSVSRSEDRTLVYKLAGSWDKGLRKSHPCEQKLFEPIALPAHAANYYGFSEFAMTLNELHPSDHPYLPVTDSRYRPDNRLLENGEPKRAEQAKKQLEQAQRKRAHLPHTPMWFQKETDSFLQVPVWRTNRRYWPAKAGRFQDEYSQQMLQLFEKELP